MADHPQAAEGRVVGGVPVGEQVVQHRVEVLLRRIPGLQQVMVDPDRVDRPDGRVGVGVGGEENLLRFGEEGNALLQELHAAHAGHPLVG